MSKLCRKESNRVASSIKDVPFYVSDVRLGDNTKDVLACRAKIAMLCKKKDCGFMIISAGKTKTIIACSIPESKIDIINATEWTNYATKNINGIIVSIDSNDTSACIEIEKINVEEEPIKMVETARSNSFVFLRIQNAIEEESSEEFLRFDDI